MGTFVYLVCMAVAGFTVLAQPAVAQGANTILPLTPCGGCQVSNVAEEWNSDCH